jgi:hypothetical protein
LKKVIEKVLVICSFLACTSTFAGKLKGQFFLEHEANQDAESLKKIVDSGKKLNDQEKVQVMEELAEKLRDSESFKLSSDGKLVVYSWVPDWKAYWINTCFVSRLISNTSGVNTNSERVKNGKVYGNGLYVSRNPFDSSAYSLTSEKRSELFEILGKNERFSFSEKNSKSSYLIVGLIDGNEKVLDLQNEEIISELESRGVLLTDVYRLNPNVLLNIPGPGPEWMLVKLRSGFTVRGATVDDLSNDLAEEAVTRMENKNVQGGQWFFRNVIKARQQ